MFSYMPPQATDWAARVDWINAVITYIAIFCTVAVSGVMMYFAVRYRRKSDSDKTPYILDNHHLESFWTFIPTVICIFMFYYGYSVYREMRNPPINALDINVDGYKWAWEYTHPSGKREAKELVVPAGKPVRLIMKSRDVTHSFFIPAMRVKEDVLASGYSYLWFNATKLGEFPIFCAEYCGTGHSAMLGTLKVVTPEAYEEYVMDRVELPPAELGKKLFAGRCTACHSIDGTKSVGPTLKGIFGHQESVVVNGADQTIDVDENYLRESILNPSAKLVKGYPNSMTPFQGQLSEKEVAGLIAFIKSLQ